MVGTTLSHYRVVELLGRGGMGEVYAAEDLKLRRRVALKVLRSDMAADHERRRRFEREAQAVAALNHPGIVTIYSVEHEKGVAFLTMEMLDGKTLDQIVPRGGLPLADFLRIAIPLADAVNAAHERGILHRDLKPGNVMVTIDGRVKVLDFGLAKLAEAAPSAALNMAAGSMTTSAGQIVGTLSYMAPEQAEGKPIDHRADIFALGVLLYELVTGIKPFSGESSVSILTALLRDTPKSLREVRGDLPPTLGQIIQQCLEKEPASRYQSAAQLRADLETLQGVPAPRARKPLPVWLPYAAAGVVATTGMVAWVSLRGGESVAIGQETSGPARGTPVLITGRQIAILDFSNRTGDPVMESFGRMVSESMATALAAQGFSVVTATNASAGDGMTIAGAYYIDGENVRFDAQLLAASRGTVIRAMEPIRHSRTSLPLAAEEVRRRMIGAVLAVYESQRPRE